MEAEDKIIYRKFIKRYIKRVRTTYKLTDKYTESFFTYLDFAVIATLIENAAMKNDFTDSVLKLMKSKKDVAIDFNAQSHTKHKTVIINELRNRGLLTITESISVEGKSITINPEITEIKKRFMKLWAFRNSEPKIQEVMIHDYFMENRVKFDFDLYLNSLKKEREEKRKPKPKKQPTPPIFGTLSGNKYKVVK